MKFASPIAFLTLVTMASSALACLPPPPGAPEPIPPTTAEKAEQIYKWSTDIVYGVVISEVNEQPRFKILRVYKGTLKRGKIIEPRFRSPFLSRNDNASVGF